MDIMTFIDYWNEGEMLATPTTIDIDLNQSFRRQMTTDRIERNWLSISQLGKPAILLGMYKAGICIPRKADDYQALKQQYAFLMGDIFEDVFLGMYEAAGGRVKWRQRTTDFLGVKGHIDAVVDDSILIDCKALSSFAYEKFTKRPHEDMYYQSQLQLYYQDVKQHGVKRAGWVVLNKGTGYLSFVEMWPDYFYEDRAEYILECLEKIQHKEDVKKYFDPPDFEVDFYTRRKAPPFSLRMELTPKLLEWVYS